MKALQVSDFHFDLPESLIAQEPAPGRADSRMLHLDRNTPRWQDRSFHDLPSLLRPDDLLVLNNNGVFPERLYGRRPGPGKQHLNGARGYEGLQPSVTHSIPGR